MEMYKLSDLSLSDLIAVEGRFTEILKYRGGGYTDDRMHIGNIEQQLDKIKEEINERCENIIFPDGTYGFLPKY